MIKAIQNKTCNNWLLYQNILETIKYATDDFNFVKVHGSHHVHLNDASKVAPYIINFIKRVNEL